MLIPRTIVEHTFDRQVLSPTIFKKSPAARNCEEHDLASPHGNCPTTPGCPRPPPSLRVALRTENRIAARPTQDMRCPATEITRPPILYPRSGAGASVWHRSRPARRGTQGWRPHHRTGGRHDVRRNPPPCKPGRRGKTQTSTRIGKQRRHPTLPTDIRMRLTLLPHLPPDGETIRPTGPTSRFESGATHQFTR